MVRDTLRGSFRKVLTRVLSARSQFRRFYKPPKKTVIQHIPYRMDLRTPIHRHYHSYRCSRCVAILSFVACCAHFKWHSCRLLQAITISVSYAEVLSTSNELQGWRQTKPRPSFLVWNGFKRAPILLIGDIFIRPLRGVVFRIKIVFWVRVNVMVRDRRSDEWS